MDSRDDMPTGQNGTRAATLAAPRFSAREIIVLALMSALIVVARSVFRIPIKVPGHSGIFWMALLVVGRGAVQRRGAGTLMGIVTGILALALVPSAEGALMALKYIAPGVTLDLMAWLLMERLDNPLLAALAGAVANVSKLIVGYIIAIALGLPTGFIALGLGLATTTHIVFGALGGWLGALLLGRLRKTDLITRLRPQTPQDPQL